MRKIEFSKGILNKYLSGECTPAEKAIVEGWYNRELKDGDMVNLAQIEEKEAEIWNSIVAYQMLNSRASAPKTIKLWKIFSAAATVAVILSVGIFFYKKGSQILPAATQTVVTSTKVNNLIQLEDGSIVILDKGSKLTFAKSFKGAKSREVYLTGKGFFDIKHLPSQPFIVHSGKIKTTVLGTAFDISANPGSDEVIVRVIRGKVNVADDSGSLGNLLPNKQITYHNKKNQSSFSDVNAQEEMQWAKQDMLLNDITFEAICKQLEKRYDVKIHIEDESLKAKKFTISLTANENLNSFLETICDYNGARYIKEDNQFIITTIN